MRYTPATPEEQQEMLRAIGVERFEDLLTGIPEQVRMTGPIPLPEGVSEMEVRADVEALAARNRGAGQALCFIGAGAYDHYVPAAIDTVVSRSEFSTAYTPYQSEVSQGTLQVIYEFQSLVAELMGLDVANASLYDGAHALAEGMLLAHATRGIDRVLAGAGLHPHHRRVVDTYAEGLGIEVVTVPLGPDGRTDAAALTAALAEPASAFLLAQPNIHGCLEDTSALTEQVRAGGDPKGPLVVADVYPVSLGLLEPPGAWGADVATAEGQSLGLPLSLGGPYVGLFACRQEHLRRMPGRLIGASEDREGRRAYVMTLMTREQPIRRAKATSNICTNEGLCALTALVYMSLMGKEGLREVAQVCSDRGDYARQRLLGVPGVTMQFPSRWYFNEFVISLPVAAEKVIRGLFTRGIAAGFPMGRYWPEMNNCLLVAVTEKRTKEDIDFLAHALEVIL